jgi:molybdopterin-containing oxidoreductase family membrane subunit
MWFERFVIVVITLHRDFMPGAWAMYNPTMWDVAIYSGTFGLFFTGFLLFLRFLPMVSIAEAKLVLPESDPHHGDSHE